MFCYQCEQAQGGKGCATRSVCGKDNETAAIQDLLTFALQGLALVAHEGVKVGVSDINTGRFMADGLFSTLTNVNFDAARFVEYVQKVVNLRDALKPQVKAAGGACPCCAIVASYTAPATLEEMVKQGEALMLFTRKDSQNEDVFSLQSILIFGLRGVAAYAHHAFILGQEDPAVYAFLYEGLAASARQDATVDEMLPLVLKCGEVNLRVMELLDAGHTTAYGHPVPTKVSLSVKAGKAILVSGHDLKDLEELLKQTEGKGISIYTHGEMLPAHGYPGLKKYPHLQGHFGGAWQDQAREFDQFPGSILMTTNCIQKPRESYKANIFTRGVVGWPGVTNITDFDFAPVIEKALSLPGFPADTDGKTVLAGFARNAVLSVAGQVIDAVKAGKIRHFFLVGGCDGANPGRNYYTEFVEQAPKDTVILTLACGKFRFFDQDLGDIGGIPRLLDIGQCNDAYSAVQIAVALAGAFNCGVNDLPLSFILSWYEQKAVSILLTLFHLGIKDIRLGPTLPAFVSPNVLQVLIDKFAIKPITTPEEDLAAILG